jgi:hypothetical protein
MTSLHRSLAFSFVLALASVSCAELKSVEDDESWENPATGDGGADGNSDGNDDNDGNSDETDGTSGDGDGGGDGAGDGTTGDGSDGSTGDGSDGSTGDGSDGSTGDGDPGDGNAGGNCAGVPAYGLGGAAYVEGSQVTSGGNLYQCKPYPYTDWCNMAAYNPGMGIYWAMAWDDLGPCN